MSSKFFNSWLGRFDPLITQTKVLARAITEMHCSIVAEMSTNSSKLHPGVDSD